MNYCCSVKKCPTRVKETKRAQVQSHYPLPLLTGTSMHHIPIINRLNQLAFLLSSLLSIQFLVCPLYVHYDRRTVLVRIDITPFPSPSSPFASMLSPHFGCHTLAHINCSGSKKSWATNVTFPDRKVTSCHNV